MSIATFEGSLDEHLELRFGGAQNSDVLALRLRRGDAEAVGGVARLRHLQTRIEVCTNDNEELFHERTPVNDKVMKMGAMFCGVPVIEEAMKFAWKKHIRQIRPYSGEPYFNHLVEVAVTLHWAGCGPQVIAAGFLHDVKEDQGVRHVELVDKFGAHVAQLVDEVTNVAEDKKLGNREFRQSLEREHLAGASYGGKSIKLADILSNTRDIVDVNPSFAPVYLKEKLLLVPLLKGGHDGLWELALLQVSKQAQRAGITV